MTDQTIPADKVRELADKYDQDKSGNPERLLVQAIADLRALLPTQQPTSGLFGKWAKHPDYGDVMCIWDETNLDGEIYVRWIDEVRLTGVTGQPVPLDSLTFPEQATRPEEVPAGEAWLVDADTAHSKVKKAIGFHYGDGEWLIVYRDGNGDIEWEDCYAKNITLVCPLVPERPVSGLQAKYDELEAKYQEAQERIKTLEQASTPRIVRTSEEYDALPVGSMVQISRGSSVMEKCEDGLWRLGSIGIGDTLHDSVTRTVLRYGRGEEQPKPAWRIEHDHTNLRVGDYIIDADGDSGRIFKKTGSGYWCADSRLVIYPEFAPFIVFPDRPAATPEAVAEAKAARDKETGE